MKHKKALLIILATLVSCQKNKGSNVSLKDEKSRISYSIGFQIGSSLKQQGIEVDGNVLNQAIQDVLGGQTQKLTMQEMSETMMNFQASQVAKVKAKGEENLKKGMAFLNENKGKEGVLTLPSGLQYKITQEGKGPIPKPTDKVKVHYKGTLIDGTVFDSSYERNQPAEFGLNEVIQGWTQGLQKFKVGTKGLLFIPSNLAYGEMDRPKIPGNSTLIFEIELLEIIKK